jgi:peptidoglycan endopeptidase LytE
MSGHRPIRRLWQSIPIVVLAVVGLSLVGCQSRTNTSATPQEQLSGTAIPMMTIVTPTPGLPPAPGVTVTAVATEATKQAAAGQNGSYTVQPGDTLYAIAAKFNVTVDALMTANSITDPSALQTNQVLVIP